jgi:hypothetical protein
VLVGFYGALKKHLNLQETCSASSPIVLLMSAEVMFGEVVSMRASSQNMSINHQML